jgi:hypothetical protein
MAKREFVQLAHKLDKKAHIGGWYISVKLDGHRCYWDGGITRGMDKADVPWANNDKDGRYRIIQIATGLWSRYGNVIHAPDWFLNDLPKCPLDGELYSPNMTRQQISSIIKSQDKGDGWDNIQYMVFDIPPYEKVFEIGLIDNINYKKRITVECLDLVYRYIDNHDMDYVPPANLRYESAYILLDAVLNGEEGTRAISFESTVGQRVKQTKLPEQFNLALECVNKWTQDIVNKGGEGTVIRDPNTTYVCERSHKLLKVKPTEDMEGTVIGYITGRETDKGSRLLGKMGAMVLTLDSGKRLELSGFTDEERALACTSDCPTGYEATSAQLWAEAHPEMECPEHIEAYHFPRGTRVTFKFRGLSDDGIPQEARYFRKDVRI